MAADEDNSDDHGNQRQRQDNRIFDPPLTSFAHLRSP
jgi:hypothetical protein